MPSGSSEGRTARGCVSGSKLCVENREMFLFILFSSLLAATSQCEQRRVHAFPGGMNDGLQHVS